MKTILTLLLVVGMGCSSTLSVMAATSNHGDRFERITSVGNSDCKGDRDDDCR